MQFNSTTMMYIAAGLVAFGLIVFVAIGASTPSPYDGFAQCLTDSGAKMYGSWWCPHCANQKKMFEGAFDQVAYVECSLNGSREFNAPVCLEKGIGDGYGVPLWEFADDALLSGERTLQELSEVSGCPLSHD